MSQRDEYAQAGLSECLHPRRSVKDDWRTKRDTKMANAWLKSQEPSKPTKQRRQTLGQRILEQIIRKRTEAPL